MSNPNNLSDKTSNGLEIEALVVKEGLTYMEACIQWLEENSLEISNCQKYIPRALIDKLSQECIESDMLRPSIVRSMTRNTLDFLM
ncbi:gp33 [Aeromonas phage 31]|uniref:Late transcription coactivator n=4 Tax=Biquartavirus TaxID=1912143 RepID=Q6U986_9CAUD|nr:late promoter transcriptional regulator [Aeromonas phage 44RR2.8t]YP_238942.1 late promoter transcriptional regulator [Aeromonas phage 31]APU00688.1 transcriptional regulator [Aeromonas phage 44RR2.8t.2]APU01107.1 transcriptional regulator [Aeromonas phage 31.2]APU02017.1 transcriptional regulator [Aeromonas phage L9-6]APU02268.1 transcriptional regulator [Aeromonas phage Riv-10]APU02516.1 transcriptional regulator [Aeromonas phage SW69-9]UYD59769.1 RNA polymerase-associated protein [Aero